LTKIQCDFEANVWVQGGLHIFAQIRTELIRLAGGNKPYQYWRGSWTDRNFKAGGKNVDVWRV